VTTARSLFWEIPHEGFPEERLDVEARMRLTQGNAVRGAAMATTCDNCHGANSVSGDTAFRNLVGQSVAAIYKQLEDYKSAKRNAAVMGGYVSPLSEQDMLDLATHFASLKADEIRDRVL
jgi:cytochrome c553